MKLKLDFDRYTYVGCVPVAAHPTHPPDQYKCIQKNCLSCDEKMWISKKKRAMKKLNPTKVKIYCFFCIVVAMKIQGYSVDDVELADIGALQ